MRARAFILLILSGLFIAACTGAGPAASVARTALTAQPVALAAAPAAAMPATTTPSPVPATATAVPTATPLPTLTPTASATPLPSPTPTAGAAVNSDLVNVRGGPGLAYPIVGQAVGGDNFTVLGRTQESVPWYEVCCLASGAPGWVRSDYLDLAGNAGSISLAVNIPPMPTVTSAQASAPDYIAPPPPPPAAAAPAVNPFTGLPGGNLGRRPVFVCLNNDPEARPQYGLGQADLVYEYLMEGYFITRYTALFYSQDAPRIGPIRSARLINVQMAPLYQAALFCSGASSPVRWTLKKLVHFPYLDGDLDDGNNTRYSYSIGTYYVTRLQSDSGRLDRFLNDWQVNRIPNTRGLHFGDYAGGAPAGRVTLPYPAVARTAWTWDGSAWARLDSDGRPYLDGNTGRQITAANVVIQWAEHLDTNIIEDSLGTRGVRIILNGSGPVKILRDGKIIDGTWRDEDPNQPPEFFDAKGAPILLHPGQTWFEVLEPGYEVTVQ